LAVCLVALVYLAPTLISDLPDQWKKYLPAEKIRLGLDLQGGTHSCSGGQCRESGRKHPGKNLNDLRENLMDKKSASEILSGRKITPSRWNYRTLLPGGF